MFGIPKEINIELIWYLCLHYSSLIPSEAWLVADWMFVGGSVHSVQLEPVWRPMMYGRHLLPDIDIWPAHVTPPPSLWYYIIYRLAQPFKVHPHTKMKSQSSPADRNDRWAPAPDQTSELAWVSRSSVRLSPPRPQPRDMFDDNEGEEAVTAPLLQLGGTGRQKLENSRGRYTIISSSNWLSSLVTSIIYVHCHFPPYSR